MKLVEKLVVEVRLAVAVRLVRAVRGGGLGAWWFL